MIRVRLSAADPIRAAVPGSRSPSAASQPLNANLTAIAGLTTTAFGRSALELADADAARTWAGAEIAGAAAAAQAHAVQRANHTGTQLASTISDFGSAALAATVSAYQPLDADLTAIAGLTTTAFGRATLEVATAAGLASYAGLANLATAGITGALTLSKTGTTPRTATFPDAAIIVAGANIDNNFSVAQTFTTLTLSGNITCAPGFGMVWAGSASISSNGAGDFYLNGGSSTGRVFIGDTISFFNQVEIGGNSANFFRLVADVVTIAGTAPGTPSAGQVLIGAGVVAAATGFNVGGNQVVGARGAAVADAGAGSGTATLGGWGFASAAEFNAFGAAFNAMKDSYNTLLARLRAHGTIAT